MTYHVKEIYYTLQGEGANTGRPAVFCRFAGCNLWSGKERHRSKAICQFCDTDFLGTGGAGGGRFSDAATLADAVLREWRSECDSSHRLVVCTGGEPLLQLDEPVVEAFHQHGFQVAVETNGTQQPPVGIDWLCVSPKAGAELVVSCGNELKLVFPQTGISPEKFEDLRFDHYFLQPMDGPERKENTRAAIQYCLDHPRWRLSVQTHKYLNIP